MATTTAAGVRGNRSRQITITTYISPAQRDALRRLHERTRVAKAEYFREAVDDLLAKYQDVLKQEQTSRSAGSEGQAYTL